MNFDSSIGYGKIVCLVRVYGDKMALSANSAATVANIEATKGPPSRGGIGFLHANILRSEDIRIISSSSLWKAFRPSSYSMGMLTSKIPDEC
jgi:hypothetical protein